MEMTNEKGSLFVTDAISELINFQDNISFPEYIADRMLYMHKTSMDFPQLPALFQDYLIPVKQMLINLPVSELPIYVTIDEKSLKRGEHHRRPGIHVDFNWHEKIKAHGEEPDWITNPEKYNDDGTNHKPPTKKDNPSEKVIHDAASWGSGQHGHRFTGMITGGMLLSTNHMAAWAYKGNYTGEILSGGDCSKISMRGNYLAALPLTEYVTFFLGPLCIHEQMPMNFAVKRQLVRINLHPEYDLEKLLANS